MLHKYGLLLWLSAALMTSTAVKAGEIMSDDMLLGSDVAGAEGAEAAAAAAGESGASSSFLSFITKPLSLLFSADEEVVTPEGKKETYLEKSTRQAAEGKLEDQMNLAYMYLYGTNGVEQDPVKAVQYYTMAAEQNDPVALNNLGSLYFSGVGVKASPKTALKLFTKSAELGNDNAAVNLAFIYLSGGTKDMVRNSKAFKLFEKAAEKGNKIAQFMLGYAYYKGFVVKPDYTKAFKLIQAAATGDARLDEAQLVLGDMYVQGHGTVQNYNNGISAFRSAVSQGNVQAYMTMARIYRDGKITPPNPVMAHALYNIASAAGVDGADLKRDEIGGKMQLQMLTEAQAQAQSFTPTPSELTTYVRQTFGENIRKYIDNNIPRAEKKEK